MRPGELLALTWDDIDFENEMISIDKTRLHGKDGLPKTKASNREIEMLPIVKKYLVEQYSLTKDNVNQKRTASEIANILDMNESDANDLLIYYNSKNLDTKMSIKDFVNFMINEVSVNPNYGSSVDANTLASLKQLQPFINTAAISK